MPQLIEVEVSVTVTVMGPFVGSLGWLPVAV